MNTTFWGPSGWKFLHTLTFIYPENPSNTDKIKMRNFMTSLITILPCKYCRASFAKYCKSLPIDNFLDTRETVIDWLYKMHNKVNKKLRAQGFCHYDNPNLEHVYKLYIPIQNDIIKIIKLNKDDSLQKAINYICNLGYEFLGSIIFNYQGYYSNCHTSEEKIKIVSVYNDFLNCIIPLICLYLEKLCEEGNNCVSRYDIPNFKIRKMLISNEPYTKLINWFYKCDILATPEHNNPKNEEYEEYFKKHIANSCNNVNADKVKSCRKYARSNKKTIKRKI